MKTAHISIGSSLWVLTTIIAQPALAAQTSEAPAPVQAAPTDDTANPAQDIIVTAQRRSQRLQEAPVAVTALSSTALEQLSVRSSQDLMQVVPGLQTATQTAGDGGGSATFFLRGMGQENSRNGSEPAVGIYVDDFYYPSLSGSLFKIVDLAQVEVLRGPQGTLFGRNTIGGAIRYRSQDPELGKLSGHVTASVGSYDRYEVSGAINVPIGDFAALRLTGGHLQQNGWVAVATGGPDAGRTRTDLVRVQARIEPTSSLYINLSSQWSRDKLDGFTYNLPGPITPVAPAPGTQPGLEYIYNLAIAPRLGLPLYTDAFKSQCFYCQPGSGLPEFSYTTYKNALVTVGWTISDQFSLKSLTGWQDVYNIFSDDVDGTVAPIFGGFKLPSQTYAFSQELQLTGKLLDDRLNFVAGAYYYNERRPLTFPTSPNIVLGAPAALGPREARTIKSYAGFIDGSFKLTEKLSLIGGYRYSEDHKTVLTVLDTSGTVLASAAATFASSTYRGGLQYQWTPDIMSYASVSSGFRAGGFNPYDAKQLPTLQPFLPETSVSYEAGLRTQFLNRRITINPTIFYVDWTNLQIASVTITNANTAATSILLQNVGKARSYGAELEWSVQPTDRVRLFGNFAYLNLHYTQVAAASGLTVANDLQRAPPITFSLGASHTVDLARGSRIVSTLNYSFEDDQQSGPKTSLLLPSYGVMNARIEFTGADRRFSIAAYVTNLLDAHYYVGGVDYRGIAGSPHYDVGRPREFGLTGKFNF